MIPPDYAVVDILNNSSLNGESAFADIFKKMAHKADLKYENCDNLPYISDFLESMKTFRGGGV
jgi:hypothetical protein